MSFSAIVYLFLWTLGIGASFLKDPVYGLITYVFVYYNTPQLQWWGDQVPAIRWSLITSLAIFFSCILHSEKFAHTKFIKQPPSKWIVMFLIISMTITPFAVDVEQSKHFNIFLGKLLIVYFLITKLIRTEGQYKLFTWAHIIGCFRFGWQGFERGRRGSRLEFIGGPDSTGPNFLAAQLVTALPFLFYYFLHGNKWEKGLCILTAPFILNAIILCNSRGSVLGIGAIGIAMLFLTRGAGSKLKLMTGMVLGGLLFVQLMDPVFWERQKTILDSANELQETGDSNRTVVWRAGFEVMKSYPFGTGGGGFLKLSAQYLPDSQLATLESGIRARSIHNTFLLIAIEQGRLGLIIFSIFLFSTMKEIYRVRKLANRSENRLYVESLALGTSLISYFVTGFFLNRLYADSLFWLTALAPALRNISRDVSQVSSEPTAKRGPALYHTITGTLIRMQLRKAKRKFND